MSKSYKEIQYCEIKCDRCSNIFVLLIITIERSRKKNNGSYFCRSCKAKQSIVSKPQCSKSYWNTEKKIVHGESVKQSVKYQVGRKNVKLIGSKNGMYGKKHTLTSKQKMSSSRKGKYGYKATAWKGGKCSLVRRIKGFQHRECKWYFRVLQRDNFTCAHCQSKCHLDVHHIVPIYKLVKILTYGKQFSTADDKFKWLISHLLIIDLNLENGMTLCRSCHNKIHNNWGSHYVL